MYVITLDIRYLTEKGKTYTRDLVTVNILSMPISP